MRIGDYSVAGCILLTGIILYVESGSISISTAALQANVITSDFFPRLLAAGLIALSGGILVTTFVADRKKATETTSTPGDPARPNVETVFRPAVGLVACLVSLGFFFVLLRPLGFIIAGSLFTAIYTYVFGPRRPLLSAIYSVAYVGTVFVIFRYAFRVIPPSGLFIR